MQIIATRFALIKSTAFVVFGTICNLSIARGGLHSKVSSVSLETAPYRKSSQYSGSGGREAATRMFVNAQWNLTNTTHSSPRNSRRLKLPGPFHLYTSTHPPSSAYNLAYS